MPNTAALSAEEALQVMDSAEKRFLTSPAFWRRAVLNSVQIGSVAAQGVLEADPCLKRYERYHERPDYSAAGKAPGEGPVMRFDTLNAHMGTLQLGDKCLPMHAVHLRQVRHSHAGECRRQRCATVARAQTGFMVMRVPSHIC